MGDQRPGDDRPFHPRKTLVPPVSGPDLQDDDDLISEPIVGGGEPAFDIPLVILMDGGPPAPPRSSRERFETMDEASSSVSRHSERVSCSEFTIR